MVLLIYDDILQLKRFSDNRKEVEGIFFKVDGVIRENLKKDLILKNNKSFFELLRQHMEYSIIMDKLTPVSDTIYKKNQSKLNKQSVEMLDEIFKIKNTIYL